MLETDYKSLPTGVQDANLNFLMVDRMFQLHKNIDLKPYNTFGIRASADGLVEFSNAVALIDYLEHNPLPESYFILGGGSNLLFTGNYSGWLFYPNIPGLHVVKENRHHIWLEAGAGVTWDNSRFCGWFRMGRSGKFIGYPGNGWRNAGSEHWCVRCRGW